ncbi:MAG: hypothetical protein UU15_C0007G0006 [Candidatus Levybacteria bacterium GW2011_GWC2_40_7]|nr:MAG: hypothetical protein UT44_C0006G0003 [Candidatus Levybacteria bacterium GW2011_GWA1_39_32]KKR73560.1 MAG: hypothetical protein UU15_C0007G0006 [Candidatus Levybacteria bacterium GW2011_GWC2_40_7]
MLCNVAPVVLAKGFLVMGKKSIYPHTYIFQILRVGTTSNHNGLLSFEFPEL